jgi:hypothetical protein
MSKITKRISIILASLLASAGLVMSLALVAAPVSAVNNNICQGVASTDSSNTSNTGSNTLNNGTSCDTLNSDTSGGTVQGLVKNILNIFSWVVGAVSVIMLIVGGFRYIISGGDSNAVQGAKNTILYALVGLVIVIFAQVIVKFVIANIGGGAGS